MKSIKSGHTNISGKVFFCVMVLLTVGMWIGLMAITNQRWMLLMIAGMLLTLLSLPKIGRYIKERFIGLGKKS